MSLTSMSINIVAKPFFKKNFLKYLMAIILLSTNFTVSTAAIADSLSNSSSVIATLTIDENNKLQANQLTVMSNSSYYQLTNPSGRILQDKLYDITPYPSGRVLAKRDGKYGMIGADGELIFDFIYDDIKLMPADLYLLSIQGSAGTMSALAKVANDWLYPVSGKFQAGVNIERLHYDDTNSISYYKTSQNGKFGLITSQGKALIAPVYDDLQLYSVNSDEEYLATVKKGSRSGLIDSNQKYVVNLAPNQKIESFNADPAIIKVTAFNPDAYRLEESIISNRLLDKTGSTLIYSDTAIKSLGNQLFKFSKDGKVGVVNNEADMITSLIFDHITSNDISVLIATKDGKQGILQQVGDSKQLAVNTYYDWLEKVYTSKPTLAELVDYYGNSTQDSSDVTFVVEEVKGDYKYVNEAKTPIDLDKSVAEDSFYDFSDSLFVARNNGKYGLIDSNNQIRIPFLYDLIQESHAPFLVKKDQKFGLLTSHNETVAGILYDSIDEWYDLDFEPIYHIVQGNKQGIISASGQSILVMSGNQIIVDVHSEISNLFIQGSDGKYGLLSDDNATIFIPPKYEKFDRKLADGSIIAQRDGKKVLINKFGIESTADASVYDAIAK